MRSRPLLLVTVALACFTAVNLYLALDTRARLDRIEAAVKQRNSADPLVARECIEVETGDSPEKPCLTTFRRLSQTPQQYHGRWVMVEGVYASGFEQSALYPVALDPEVSTQQFDPHTALWVDLSASNLNDKPIITVVGRFSRGPAGHMGDYFGELTDAKVWSRSNHAPH